MSNTPNRQLGRHPIGEMWALYQQCSVSTDRLSVLLQGAPQETLVAHGPVYVRGDLPEIPYRAKTDTHRLESLSVSGLTYRYPDSERGTGVCARPGDKLLQTCEEMQRLWAGDPGTPDDHP